MEVNQMKLDAAVREIVIKKRKSGMTLQQIADEKGCSRQAIHQMLKRYAAAVDRRKREA